MPSTMLKTGNKNVTWAILLEYKPYYEFCRYMSSEIKVGISCIMNRSIALFNWSQISIHSVSKLAD